MHLSICCWCYWVCFSFGGEGGKVCGVGSGWKGEGAFADGVGSKES